jgi:hypothetical protein
MLRRSIALAARGENSQLSGREIGGDSQFAASARSYIVEKQRLFCLAQLML